MDRLLGDCDWQQFLRQPLGDYDRVRVVGMGKAALAMASVLERQLADTPCAGVVVVPHGYAATLPEGFERPRRIEVLEAEHPIPGPASVRAARCILREAAACEAGDLLLALVSGGGSALCADFAGGISLAAAQATFKLLLECGAGIHDVNTVRKHLSRIGGGRLAQAAAGDVLALVVSDVVGDDLSIIASGPTVPDPSTFHDAVAVLRAFGVWDGVPRTVRDHLLAGTREPGLETPKPGAEGFERVRTVLVGTNRTALAAAAEAARMLGYAPRVLGHDVTGEARAVGARLASEALASAPDVPVCLLWGGETTVTVTGTGRGGRNQEVALAAALALEGASAPVAFLSVGTDGRDGPTDAAGAWVTHRTAAQARRAGLNPEDYLARNDAYTFFEAVGSLLKTGPTHTNVMDVQVALLDPPGDASPSTRR